MNLKVTSVYIILGATLLTTYCSKMAIQDAVSKNINSAQKPQDDFFEFANGGWFKANPIPDEESGWGIANAVVNNNFEKLKEINEKAASNLTSENKIDNKIGYFWKTGMDSVAIEKNGIQDLEPLFSKIEEIKSVSDLSAIFASLNRIKVAHFFNFYIAADDKNSQMNAVRMGQQGIGLPDKEYYFKTDTETIVIQFAYKKYLSSLIKLAKLSTSQPEKMAADIFNFEKQIAMSHRSLEALRDAEKNYNKIPVSQIQSSLTCIDFINYLKLSGLNHTKEIIIGQPEYFTAINKLLENRNLHTIKAILKLNLISAYIDFLPSQFVNTGFEYSKTLSGAKKMKPRWKRVLRAEENLMGEALGQLFVKEFFNEKAKERYNNLVEAIRESFKSRIENLDWMSSETKKKAQHKLAVMSKKVGYPDKWKDFSAMEIGNFSYVKNAMNANNWWYSYMLKKENQPVDKTEWEMSPQTYNAYYNPSNNEIVLPAGIFVVPGFADADLDDAVVYGYAGATTIGHEITHGFDDEGRKFDAYGNLKEWWTEEDAKKFEKKTQLMVELFNSFKPIDTLRINGAATLGENIADLGGAVLAWDAFVKTDCYKKNEKIGGYSPAQRFFLGYALGWLNQQRPEELRRRLLTDVHSPAKYRVNGIFMSVPAFYQVWNVKEGDKMYLNPNKRVSIW